MRLILNLLILILSLNILSCSSKNESIRKQNIDRHSILKKMEKAIEELEKEVTKPAKDLNLEEESYKNDKNNIISRKKYPIVNGYPIWFWNPNYENNVGAVGIVKVGSEENFNYYKELAKKIAIVKLAKKINITINTVVKRESSIRNKNYESRDYKFSTYSIQKTERILIKKAIVKDMWLNPSTKELLVWVVLQK